jgi:hypothetical protein
MSFAAYDRDPIRALLAAAGDAGKVTLLVGAGASMEAGLPSWERLLDRLLLRGGEEASLIETVPLGAQPTVEQAEQRRRWLAEAARDGPMGKAALAEALADDQRDAWIADALYGPGSGPEAYFPGPIARQLPALAKALAADLRLLTLNYDDLIEQAFRQDGTFEPRPLTGHNQRVPAGAIGVVHLHGYLGRHAAEPAPLVLSEADYVAMQRGMSWQETTVQQALMDSTLIFVGTSMLDSNVIRYLHGVRPPDGGQPARFALFVRQGTYDEAVPHEVRMAREQALARRWQALGVGAVFVDHYTDVAQVLAEIARRRRLGPDYVPLPARVGEWIDTVERTILGCHDDDRFTHGQRIVNELLRSALERAVAEAERLGGASWKEKLQLALWLVDCEGTHLTTWVMSDRLHIDRDTIEHVPIGEYARWVAIRSFCAGAPLAETRDVYASRWRFVRGTPLVLETERHGRIPVGCLTTATKAARDDTQLDAMPDAVLAAFNDALSATVLTLLDQPFATEAEPVAPSARGAIEGGPS